MIDSLSASLRPISLLQSILYTIVKVILIKKNKIYHVIHLLDIFWYLPSSLRVKSNMFTQTRKTLPHPLRFCWPQLLTHHPSPDSSHTSLPARDPHTSRLLNMLLSRLEVFFHQCLCGLLPHCHTLLFYFLHHTCCHEVLFMYYLCILLIACHRPPPKKI